MTAAEHEAALWRRRHLAVLRKLAERLDRDSQGNVHVTADPKRNRYGYTQRDQAFAIRWALRQLAPETECVRQTLDALSGAVAKPMEAAE